MKTNLIICGGASTGKSLLANYIKLGMSDSHEIIDLNGRDPFYKRGMNIDLAEPPLKPLLIMIDSADSVESLSWFFNCVAQDIVIRRPGQPYFMIPYHQVRFIVTTEVSK